ncbi:carbohydrate-binding module family 48 protein [Gonapodya prolifera JEL478]|uniref:Carbohydrate-binding module family 48 protein n=1 Tax=Gonapodya prolifera (strain JEL478) TaxID=1344416 RepID=A0A139A4N5_GONPJ|nr:carbohydrate-binding module family 48 protein [Gonapodya prolifera JEL478]|eukprot:KXS11756.1 carbohydrate-binding module family 48 protein [Gonapodya prolifera JEL478]
MASFHHRHMQHEFIFEPKGHGLPAEVTLTGTMDRWQRSLRMERALDDRMGLVFKTKVPVPLGSRLEYKFIIDGDWQVDYTKPVVPAAFGGLNNLLETPFTADPADIAPESFTHTFVYAPPFDALKVVVTGWFDQWSESVTMEKRVFADRGPIFFTRVELPWGARIEYKYIADGQWLCDPKMPICTDPLTNQNNYVLTPPLHTPIDPVYLPPPATLALIDATPAPAPVTLSRKPSTATYPHDGRTITEVIPEPVHHARDVVHTEVIPPLPGPTIEEEDDDTHSVHSVVTYPAGYRVVARTPTPPPVHDEHDDHLGPSGHIEYMVAGTRPRTPPPPGGTVKPKQRVASQHAVGGKSTAVMKDAGAGAGAAPIVYAAPVTSSHKTAHPQHAPMKVVTEIIPPMVPPPARHQPALDDDVQSDTSDVTYPAAYRLVSRTPTPPLVVHDHDEYLGPSAHIEYMVAGTRPRTPPLADRNAQAHKHRSTPPHSNGQTLHSNSAVAVTYAAPVQKHSGKANAMASPPPQRVITEIIPPMVPPPPTTVSNAHSYGNRDDLEQKRTDSNRIARPVIVAQSSVRPENVERRSDSVSYPDRVGLGSRMPAPSNQVIPPEQVKLETPNPESSEEVVRPAASGIRRTHQFRSTKRRPSRASPQEPLSPRLAFGSTLQSPSEDGGIHHVPGQSTAPLRSHSTKSMVTYPVDSDEFKGLSRASSVASAPAPHSDDYLGPRDDIEYMVAGARPRTPPSVEDFHDSAGRDQEDITLYAPVRLTPPRTRTPPSVEDLYEGAGKKQEDATFHATMQPVPQTASLYTSPIPGSGVSNEEPTQPQSHSTVVLPPVVPSVPSKPSYLRSDSMSGLKIASGTSQGDAGYCDDGSLRTNVVAEKPIDIYSDTPTKSLIAVGSPGPLVHLTQAQAHAETSNIANHSSITNAGQNESLPSSEQEHMHGLPYDEHSGSATTLASGAMLGSVPSSQKFENGSSFAESSIAGKADGNHIGQQHDNETSVLGPTYPARYHETVELQSDQMAPLQEPQTASSLDYATLLIPSYPESGTQSAASTSSNSKPLPEPVGKHPLPTAVKSTSNGITAPADAQAVVEAAQLPPPALHEPRDRSLSPSRTAKLDYTLTPHGFQSEPWHGGAGKLKSASPIAEGQRPIPPIRTSSRRPPPSSSRSPSPTKSVDSTRTSESQATSKTAASTSRPQDATAHHNAEHQAYFALARQLHEGIERRENIKAVQALTFLPPDELYLLAKAFTGTYQSSINAYVRPPRVSGMFGKVLESLTYTPLEHEVRCLHDALYGGWGFDKDTLVDILIGKSNDEIEALKEMYQRTYKKSLVAKVLKDTSNLGYLFGKVLEGRRQRGTADVMADVEALYIAGEAKLGTDERVFIDILTSRSSSHLKLVFEAYERTHGKSFLHVVESEFGAMELSFSLSAAMRRLVKSVTYEKEDFVAEDFYDSMKGLGHKEEKLSRLAVVYRAPQPIMKTIKTVFYRRYKRTLAAWIEDETSGDYRAALHACIGYSPGVVRVGVPVAQ